MVMARYLLVFGHSEFGAHQYRIDAENDQEAEVKAIERLERSPMASMTYDLFRVRPVIEYQRWTRK